MPGKIPLKMAGSERHEAPLVVGIDLGTTNSLIATMQGDRPTVLASSPEECLVPSVVHYGQDGRVLVGREALPYLPTDPGRTIYSVKRLMGRASGEVAEERERLPYQLSQSHQDVVRIQVNGESYTPPEVSAQILRALKTRAETLLEKEVRQAVITVPAYFDDSQRQATRDAGRIAGLDVLRILNEPTAACLAYGLHERGEGTVAVYDLGGGTFDISILKLKGGIFEVLSTSGDTHLGGDDMDSVLADSMAAEIRELHAIDVSTDPGLRQRLRLAAEQAKRELTEAETTSLEIRLDDERLFRRELSREELEELITPVVEQTLGPCRQALADAGLAASDLDEVVLVGGSTRTPLVRRCVEELFGRRPHCELDPEQVVAVGAAVQAGILAGQVTGMLLLDVNPLSLGLETMGGAVERIIPRNSTIPTSAQQVFTTAVDNQTSFDLHVVQGERELADDCRSLARFAVKIPPMPAGWPRLDITFLIDENGLLNVAAREQRSDTEAHVEVKPSSGLTDGEIESMIIDSFEHAEEDIERRRLVDASVDAEQVIRATEKQLPLAEQFVSKGEMTREEVERIQRALEALRAAYDSGDASLIQDRIAELDATTRSLAQEVWSLAITEALQGKTVAAVVEQA